MFTTLCKIINKIQILTLLLNTNPLKQMSMHEKRTQEMCFFLPLI